ncbi:MAG: hypothetical protein ABJC66_17350 [Gammaproteobacteria bacterium]
MSAEHPKRSQKPRPDDAGEVSAPDAKSAAKSTGRVQFDDKGNAIWEWSIATGAFGREVSAQRLQALEHPALSIAEDAPTPLDSVRANPLGNKKGYDPYDSGKLGKRPPTSVKKDLRRLGEAIKLKKQAADNKDDE